MGMARVGSWLLEVMDLPGTGASVRRNPCYTSASVRVAQLDRALPSEGKGCRFDSRHGRFRKGPDCWGPFA